MTALAGNFCDAVLACASGWVLYPVQPSPLPCGHDLFRLMANVLRELSCSAMCSSSGFANYLSQMDPKVLCHIQADILIMYYSHC